MTKKVLDYLKPRRESEFVIALICAIISLVIFLAIWDIGKEATSSDLVVSGQDAAYLKLLDEFEEIRFDDERTLQQKVVEIALLIQSSRDRNVLPAGDGAWPSEPEVWLVKMSDRSGPYSHEAVCSSLERIQLDYPDHPFLLHIRNR